MLKNKKVKRKRQLIKKKILQIKQIMMHNKLRTKNKKLKQSLMSRQIKLIMLKM